ncbi:MAG TPA: retropepsin-like aspartic protease [Chitinophagales bacterium]|nr:retropepsin-like aspartic protease [Chitinophagales bacterium]
MNHLILLLLLYAIPFVLLSQADRSKFLYTADGKFIGEKKQLIEECASELEEDSTFARADREEVCGCILTTLAGSLTYKEINQLLDGEEFNFEKVFNNRRHPETGNMLMECIFSFLRNGNAGKGSAYRKQFVEECISGFQEKADGFPLETIDIESYCDCMIDKLLTDESLSRNFFHQAQDENSVLMNEAVVPCLLAAIDTSLNGESENMQTDMTPLKTVEGTATDAGNPDIRGDVISQEIALSKYLSIYRVKVRIGTLEKSFILDSGASDVLVSKAFEKELLDAGLLKKADMLGEKLYQLADGSKVKGRIYMLSGLQIGGFTIDNVVAGVISEDASLLLGKSFLDKFKKWKIDNERNTLYLER